MNITCRCDETYSINFYSPENQNLTVEFLQTANQTVFQKPTNESPPPEKSNVPFICSLLVLIIVLVCILVDHWRKKKRALVAGEITNSPTIPEWTRTGYRTCYSSNGIRFECQNYRKAYIQDRYSKGEYPQGAVDWVRRRLKKQYGDNFVSVPNTVRIVSVPMKNFECEGSCTDFQPLSGMAPGAFLTYQMCGDQKIQVTRYVENGVSYVAGYCVYINEPYERSWFFKKTHIDNCYTGPEYILRIVPPRIPARFNHISATPFDWEIAFRPIVPTVDLKLEKRMRETSKTLRVSFCESLKQPVMIGFDDGVIKHFQWQEATKTYKISDCSSCKLTELEDDPPPYHLLEV